MGRNLTIAFAGTGSIGQRHIRNLLALAPDSKLVFLRAYGQEDELSFSLGATVVETFDALKGHSPDGIVISTPSAIHTTALGPAIDASIPVYIEKPVVTDEVDLGIIRSKIADKPELVTLIGCNLRFLPSLCIMRACIKDGAIGTIVRAHFEAGQWLPDWRPNQNHQNSYSADPVMGGGVILDLLHEIDTAEWMCGPLDIVAAQSGRLPRLGIASESSATLLLQGTSSQPEVSSLPLVTVGLDYVARQPIREYRVIGDCGTLIWSLSNRTLRLETAEQSTRVDCPADGFDMAATYENAMREFVAALQSGGQTSNPIQTGLRSNELALKAKELSK